MENGELVTERENLRLQGGTGSKTGGNQSEKGDEKTAHRDTTRISRMLGTSAFSARSEFSVTTGISQATNCGNTGSCDFAALANSAHDLSIARCRWFEHSRNGAAPRGANRNSEGTARQGSCETQTSYSEELPGKCQAIHVQSPTIRRDRARRRCCALTDLLEDGYFRFIRSCMWIAQFD